MRELLSIELGAALRRVNATGHCEGVPKRDLETLLLLGFLRKRLDGVVQITELGRDILKAEDSGS